MNSSDTRPVAVVYRPTPESVHCGFLSPYDAEFVSLARNFGASAWFAYEKRVWYFPASRKDEWIAMASRYWEVIDTSEGGAKGLGDIHRTNAEYKRGYETGRKDAEEEWQYGKARLQVEIRKAREEISALREQLISARARANRTEGRMSDFGRAFGGGGNSGPYKVLEVMDGASKEVCEAAYKVLSRKYHPDTGGSHEKMVAVNRAMDELRKKW